MVGNVVFTFSCKAIHDSSWRRISLHSSSASILPVNAHHNKTRPVRDPTGLAARAAAAALFYVNHASLCFLSVQA